MTHGKRRTVYLYEVIEKDANDERVDLTPGFWDRLHARMGTQPVEIKQLEYRGRKYVGDAYESVNPATNYFYFCKARPGADWPDVDTPTGGSKALSLQPNERLVEPIYMLPYRHTNIITTVRTSGGPLPQAVEAWLNRLHSSTLNGGWFELWPVANEDQRQRLQTATGATMIDVRTDPRSQISADGTIDGSLEALGDQFAHAAMGLKVSFGNAIPGEGESENLLDLVKHFFRNREGTTRLKATLLRPGENGGEERDKIDFLRDKVQYSEVFGDSEDHPATASEVLHGLASAQRKYSENRLTLGLDELE